MRMKWINYAVLVMFCSCGICVYAGCNLPSGVTLITETVATRPYDRTRTKLGVGEEVTLRLNPSPSSTVSWSIAGQGSLSSTTGSSVIFTAHERASSPSITASYDSYSCSVSFDVVEPSSISMVKVGDGRTVDNPLGVLMTLVMYVGPEDVNFSKLMIAEQECPAVCTGYYAYKNGLNHIPGADAQVSDTLVVGRGWLCNGFDTASLGSQGAPYSNGEFRWPIPTHYVINGNSYWFITVDQVGSLEIGTDGKATLTLSKAGASASHKEP